MGRQSVAARPRGNNFCGDVTDNGQKLDERLRRVVARNVGIEQPGIYVEVSREIEMPFDSLALRGSHSVASRWAAGSRSPCNRRGR